MFSDSVTGNKEIMRELLAALPPSQRDHARRAAMKIEKAFTDLQRDYPKNAAVALGTAFAIYAIAERITTQAKESDGKGLIEMIN
jgi:hypothetical protein